VARVIQPAISSVPTSSKNRCRAAGNADLRVRVTHGAPANRVARVLKPAISLVPTASKNENRSQLLKAYRRLGKLYGIPRRRRSGTALDELILTILSQNTNDRNSGEGFRRLKAAFADWAAVENAPWQKVAAALRVAGLANVKSRRIQAILRRLREAHGGYTLEFLRKMETTAARDYLLAIPGVGPKTAACVLLFSFGKPVFPVDTHIHRVTRRLGIIPEKMNAEAAHEELQKLVPLQLAYPLHILLIRHGRNTCHAQHPTCPECVLLDICPTGKRLTATA